MDINSLKLNKENKNEKELNDFLEKYIIKILMKKAN